ncbi:hypothetical protein AMTR_s00007p00213870 [Amborella trichopoda]|uniref:Uncharacterized protein n=1 Tax=Amborella trichopoda TaxID=13333 RepID=W1PCM7_AMBTC|nr:hypothetical protein AMTR_s00007p00213870 [Amborella trichopoda]
MPIYEALFLKGPMPSTTAKFNSLLILAMLFLSSFQCQAMARLLHEEQMKFRETEISFPKVRGLYGPTSTELFGRNNKSVDKVGNFVVVSKWGSYRRARTGVPSPGVGH